MARTLRDDVYVDGRRYTRGMTREQAGDVAFGDHVWVGEDDDAPAAGQPARAGTSGETVDPTPDEAVEQALVRDVEGEDALADRVADDVAEDGAAEAQESPPLSGPGSGAQAWRDYARAQGVEVADDAKRDDVVAAVEKARGSA